MRTQQLKECPKCKAKHGWYEKRVQWGEQFFLPNGESSHYCDTNGRGGTRQYCVECGRNITACIGEQSELNKPTK